MSVTPRAGLRETGAALLPAILEDKPHRLTLGYYARGWWDLTIVDALQPRLRARKARRCESPECTKPVPADRKKYCSATCAEREKNHRKGLRAENAACG